MSFACFTISCVVVYLPQRTEPSFLAAQLEFARRHWACQPRRSTSTSLSVAGQRGACWRTACLRKRCDMCRSFLPSAVVYKYLVFYFLNLPRMFFFFISHKKESPQFSCRFSVFLSLKSRQKNCSTSYLQATRIRFARTAFGSVHVPTFQLN